MPTPASQRSWPDHSTPGPGRPGDARLW